MRCLLPPLLASPLLLALVPMAPAAEAVHATWRATPVASIGERIGSLTGMPVVIDRRIDPTRRIDLEGAGRPPEAVLHDLAEAAGGELATLRHSFRICPTGLAGRVTDADASRAARLAKLASPSKDAIETVVQSSWEAGTPPKELVARLAEEAAIPIGPLDTIPDDHLPAGSLPPLSLGDKLDLVLAHYDLRIEPEARGRRGLAIVPLDEADAAAPVARRPERRDNHRDAQGGGKPVPIDRYTLRAEAPLEELLQALTKKFALTLNLDATALAAKGVAAGEIVRVNVKDAPRSDLLDAITKPLGLSWKIDGTTLDVR